ncbi:hypothetical protein AMTR_s00055p00210510 [Amborella trichopoda]|uniref:Uncharacterized protein n=1 Tax=Amborella trichopoda TaxID=13333 RepID=U5D7Y5_AMBTC|nr:hypothetical protein AMTR_s00055p00210510 [Amborella trichopoda]
MALVWKTLCNTFGGLGQLKHESANSYDVRLREGLHGVGELGHGVLIAYKDDWVGIWVKQLTGYAKP